MRKKLQWMALGRAALWFGRRAAGTPLRRPLLVAAATGAAMLHVLPGGATVLPVEIADAGGRIEQAFTLAVDDPQVETLRRAAEAASHPDYRKRSADFYRAQWDATAAEFYLTTSQPTADTESVSQAGRPASPKLVTSEAVSPASYQKVAAASGVAEARPAAPKVARTVAHSDGQHFSGPVASAAAAAVQDWAAYWGQLRESGAQRMRRLEPAPRVDPKLAGLRFGAVQRGPYPTLSVFAALCVAGIAFAATRQWACHVPRRLIGLRSEQQVVVPAEWVRHRRGWRAWKYQWTRGRTIEAAATAILLLAFLFG